MYRLGAASGDESGADSIELLEDNRVTVFGVGQSELSVIYLMAIRDLVDVFDVSGLTVQSISIGSKVDFVDGSLDNHSREETSNDNRELHFYLVKMRGDKDEMSTVNARQYLYFFKCSFKLNYERCKTQKRYTAQTFLY